MGKGHYRGIEITLVETERGRYEATFEIEGCKWTTSAYFYRSSAVSAAQRKIRETQGG